MERVPNEALVRARRRTPSPVTPGEPLSRPELAGLVNAWLFERTNRVAAMTAGYVGKLERGVIRWPHQGYRDALRAVLAADTDRELGFRRPVRAVTDFSAAPTGETHSSTICHTAAAVPSWREVVERGRLALRRETVDGQLVTALEQTAATVASMYRSADPRATTTMTAALGDQLLRLLDAGGPDDLRTRLTAVTAGVHAQVGLWAFHDDQRELAYRHLATACQVAEAAGDPGLRARALGAFSYLFSSAPRGGRGGDPARALGLLDQASALVPAGDHFTRGWLATWRADQLATLGELVAARADVDVAAAALDQADTGPSGFFSRSTYGYGIRQHLDSVRGLLLALGDDADSAERTFDAVQSAAVNMRRVVATYGHTALARSRLRDPEGTCEALTKSVVTALREHYPMGLRRALGVRAGFDPAWAGLPCVRELDELLHIAFHGPDIDPDEAAKRRS